MPLSSTPPSLPAIAIERIGAANCDETLALKIGELLCGVWPKPGRTPAVRATGLLTEFAKYRGPSRQAPRGFLIRDGAAVVAYAAVTPRTIDADGQLITIAALASVCADERYRGNGLGAAIARAALGSVDEGDFPWSLFQTTPPVRPFYERLGAAVVINPIVNSLADDPQANPFWDGVVMRYPAIAPCPQGTIDLLGPGY